MSSSSSSSSSSPSKGKKKAKRTGNSRSRSREKDRSRSRSPGGKGKKGKLKGQTPAEWTKEEVLDKLRTFAQFNLDKASGSGLLIIKDRRLMSEDLQIICETFGRCKYIIYFH